MSSRSGTKKAMPTTDLIDVIGPCTSFSVSTIGRFSIFLIPCTTSHTCTPSTILNSKNMKTLRLRSFVTHLNSVGPTWVASFESWGVFPFKSGDGTISRVFPTAYRAVGSGSNWNCVHRKSWNGRLSKRNEASAWSSQFRGYAELNINPGWTIAKGLP